MREDSVADAGLLHSLLQGLEEAKQRLVDTMTQVTDEEFEWQGPDGQSIRQVLEKAVDDVNFFYGWLVGRVRGRPPLPCIQPADFLSIREAMMGLQVAHRRFTNQLHDLTPADLERTATHEEAGTFSLHQVLEMATEHYLQRAQQVEHLRRARQGALP